MMVPAAATTPATLARPPHPARRLRMWTVPTEGLVIVPMLAVI